MCARGCLPRRNFAFAPNIHRLANYLLIGGLLYATVLTIDALIGPLSNQPHADKMVAVGVRSGILAMVFIAGLLLRFQCMRIVPRASATLILVTLICAGILPTYAAPCAAPNIRACMHTCMHTCTPASCAQRCPSNHRSLPRPLTTRIRPEQTLRGMYVCMYVCMCIYIYI